MFKEITLKTALAVSVSLHLLFLSPWHALRFAGVEDRKDEIEVTYVLEEFIHDELEKEITTLPEKYDLEQKKLEEPRGEAEEAQKEEMEAQAPEREDRFLEEEDAKKLEEYISYYELIREKIKKYVTRYYTRPSIKGKVDVMFRLDKKGVIKELNTDTGGAKTPYLDKIARKAVKSAAPFPPFPAALEREELTFTISVIFKKE